MKRNGEFTITGADDIEKILSKMPYQLARRSMLSAFRKGAGMVRDDAKTRVPVDSGRLKKDIALRVPPRALRKTKETVLVLGVKKPSSRRAHLTEFGTGPRYQESTGRYTGSSPAKPFLRPALDSKGQRAAQIITDTLWENIQTIARQLRRNIKVSLRRK